MQCWVSSGEAQAQSLRSVLPAGTYGRTRWAPAQRWKRAPPSWWKGSPCRPGEAVCGEGKESWSHCLLSYT